MVIGGRKVSKYKVGDKIVLTVTNMTEMGGYPRYVLNTNFNLWKQSIDDYAEPLSTYTEPLESKIQKQSAEILKQKEIIDKLLNENEKLMFKIDAYKLYGDQHEEEYNQAFNQGAETAWELAKKIILHGKDFYSGEELKEIFGYAYSETLMKNYTYPEAAAKVAEWEKAKEKIKVGDVLEYIYDSNVKCTVTILYTNNMAYLVFDDGTAGIHELNDFKKTGRRIPIDSFLKQIGGESDEK